MPYDTASKAYDPYLADADGKLLRNTWYQDEPYGYRYYFDETCRKVAGWNVIDGKTYYMDLFGVMQTGWVEIDGERYHFGTDGALIPDEVGWHDIGDKKYYRDENGKNHKRSMAFSEK